MVHWYTMALHGHTVHLHFACIIHSRYDEKLKKDTESYNKYLSSLEAFVEVANTASTVKIVHQHEI